MKITSEVGMVAAIATLLSTAPNSRAVVGQALQVQGTNLVLSWPSQSPYQQYMIEYRQTLDQSTPWNQIANAYPASGGTTTTYTNYGAIPAPQIGNGGGGGTDTNPPPSPLLANSSFAPSEPLATPANGTGSIVPLALYPLGYDISRLLIYAPATQEWLSGADYVQPQLSLELGLQPMDDPQPQDGGGDNPPSSGFYRVWHIPTWSFNITNYIYDGPTFLPIDFADYMDRVKTIQVLLNGQQTYDAVFMPFDMGNGETNWGMGIYFDMLPSGTYQIQLQTTLRQNELTGDLTGEAPAELVLTNLTRSIVVDNQITYTNWDGLIQGSNFTYTAQTKRASTDWEIDLYDAYDNYVNSGRGHTDNGQIAWTWNLTDTNGNPRDDLDTDPFFYAEVTFATSSGQNTSRTAPAPQTAYPNVGYWLFSYDDNRFTDAGQQYARYDQTYRSTFPGMAGWVTYRGIPASVFPLKFGTNAYTQQQRDDSWAQLKARLFQPQCRNFYYAGHGTSGDIGSDANLLDANGNILAGVTFYGSKALLTTDDVRQIIFNKYTGARPYRFVWLDACSTANGGWPVAFGIEGAPHDMGWYTNSVTNPQHARPSAFAGWNKIVGAGNLGGDPTDYYNYRSQVMQQWSYSWQTEGLHKAFDDAVSTTPWPPGRQGALWGGLCIYGYQDIRLNEFNQKNDWRWP